MNFNHTSLKPKQLELFGDDLDVLLVSLDAKKAFDLVEQSCIKMPKKFCNGDLRSALKITLPGSGYHNKWWDV